MFAQSLYKLYHPEIFQGNLSSKRYFEGWYFKHVTADLQHIYSFIPGISLNKEDPHAFIQMIDGVKGRTKYFQYNLSDFHTQKRALDVQIGTSRFTKNFIELDIRQDGYRITGRLQYSGLTPYPASLLSPGIMGWYSFVPQMECKHGVVSVNHHVHGMIEINEESISFDQGKGYIEKDWGISFPKAWIWAQCNSFKDASASIMVSIAHIPWMGSYFPGFISFFHTKGEYIIFSTYNGSKLLKVEKTSSGLRMILENSKHHMEVEVVQHQFGELKAPKHGIMSRFIKESLDSHLNVTLKTRDGKTLFEDTGQRAGFEIVEEIFQYLKTTPVI